ncbi:MAG TPA: ankyrin repeat domain-containing protein [Thermoanaerobaculia bacterium]|nr:ankyrin repeat domain-containing protein [Thermoanaerobaculia bacterium]
MRRLAMVLLLLLPGTAFADAKEDFRKAAGAGDVGTVKRLLAEDPSLAEGAVQAALFILVKGEGFLPPQENEILKMVVAAKPKLDLYDAAAVGSAEQVAAMLRADKDAVRAKNQFGWTALHVAAFAGNVETARVLIDAGADIHVRAKTRFRNTPLQVALLTGQYGTAKLLLERGADPLDRQAGGFAPIHEAAFLGRADLVQLLLDHGAELNSRSDDGRTAIAEAERGKHEAVAKLLREKGAK